MISLFFLMLVKESPHMSETVLFFKLYVFQTEVQYHFTEEYYVSFPTICNEIIGSISPDYKLDHMREIFK